MDLAKQLKSAMTSGSLLFGQKQSIKACANGEARMLIMAANCPRHHIDEVRGRHPDIPLHQVTLVNRELGSACARPFPVSSICVIDAGNSDLLTLRPNIE
jgi:large subunit ribosomal protein L30e